MRRKDFLGLCGVVGGALGLSAFLQACRRILGEPNQQAEIATRKATSTFTNFPSSDQTAFTQLPATKTLLLPTPTPTPDPSVVQVSMVKTLDRRAGVREAVELFGMPDIRGKQVVVKPNFNSADAPPGSTHNDTLESLLELLVEAGAAGIAIADRSGMGNTQQVMQSKGIFTLAKRYGAEVVVLDELPESEWQLVSREDLHWNAGFPVPKMLLEAESIIQTCNLKTHRYGGHFTLSLKNSIGMVGKKFNGRNYMNELHNSPNQRKMISEANLVYEPDLVVMDGVLAFTDGGPDTGTVVQPGVVLASTDRIALDAIGVAILRYFGTTLEVRSGTVFSQEQIARAVELGLGISSPEKINLTPGDEEAALFWEEIKELL